MAARRPLPDALTPRRVLTLVAPGVTAFVLLLDIAIWAVATGVVEIVVAVQGQGLRLTLGSTTHWRLRTVAPRWLTLTFSRWARPSRSMSLGSTPSR